MSAPSACPERFPAAEQWGVTCGSAPSKPVDVATEAQHKMQTQGCAWGHQATFAVSTLSRLLLCVLLLSNSLDLSRMLISHHIVTSSMCDALLALQHAFVRVVQFSAKVPPCALCCLASACKNVFQVGLYSIQCCNAYGGHRLMVRAIFASGNFGHLLVPGHYLVSEHCINNAIRLTHTV